MKVDVMNLKNKAVLVTTSVIAVSALLLASPALAHKNPGKPGPKGTNNSVVASPTPSTSPTPPVSGRPGDRDGRGHHGKGHGPKGHGAPITQTVTVDVPATGTYQLLITEVKPAKAPTPPAGAPNRPARSFTVDVTGTGSQTITLNLPHPGQYKVSLISVASTQSITVAAPTK